MRNLEKLHQIYESTCNAYEWKIDALEKKVQELENQNELLTIKKERADSLLIN